MSVLEAGTIKVCLKCFCVWLRFRPIIKFLGQIFRSDFFFFWPTFVLWVGYWSALSAFSSFPFYTCPRLISFVASCFPSLFFFSSHHLSSFLSFFSHPSRSCFIHSTIQTRKRRSDSLQFFHKSRKYKYTFLPRWPTWHFHILLCLQYICLSQLQCSFTDHNKTKQ